MDPGRYTVAIASLDPSSGSSQSDEGFLNRPVSLVYGDIRVRGGPRIRICDRDPAASLASDGSPLNL
jgi:hypothetical protein